MLSRPTPSQPLYQENSFSKEVLEWLLSAGFKSELGRETDEVFCTIKVFKDQVLSLQIKLIEINLWRCDGAANEFKSYTGMLAEQRSSGMNSIILWEDQWKNKPDIVKSRLKSLLGFSIRIPARLTFAARINKDIARDFLVLNHLQGFVQSKYQFGLYLPVRYFRVLPLDYQPDKPDKDLLVALATFSHVRVFSLNEKPFRSFELIRFSSLINTTVVGGLDKLLSSFIKQIHPDDIMTYIDLEWSEGASYRRLGFEGISEIPPIAFWLDAEQNERFPERNYTPAEQMIKICNAGSLKFVKTIKQKTE